MEAWKEEVAPNGIRKFYAPLAIVAWEKIVKI